MIELLCDKCSTPLDLDKLLTMQSYDTELKEILDTNGEIYLDPNVDYLLFTCGRCNFYKKVDIQKVIDTIKSNLIKIISNTRVNFALQNMDNSGVKEDNGVDYCGICPGVIDSTGYCYNDVINKCYLRKLKLDVK